MTPPKSFVDSLQKQLPHLRIRWSRQSGMWHIEQKVGRSIEVPFFVSEYDDRSIRARDGVLFVMAVTNGDRIGCPRCKAEVHVPIRRMAQAICPRCRAAFNAAHYPLADTLLEHLRYSDPYRGGVERQINEIDLHNERRDLAWERSHRNEANAVAADLFPQLMGIPKVGYTGREFK